jgi:hypothetical protein
MASRDHALATCDAVVAAAPRTHEGPTAGERRALARAVAVKWLDHASEPDWTPVEQLRSDPQEVITVGIPVKETADALLLAATVSETDLPMSQWVVAETTMILKALIVWRLPIADFTDAAAKPRTPESGELGLEGQEYE